MKFPNIDQIINNKEISEREAKVMSFYIDKAPFEVSVDVGAGTGLHISKLCDISKKVYAFEPIKEHADKIKNRDNLEIIKKGVWSMAGNKKLKIPGNLKGNKKYRGTMKQDIWKRTRKVDVVRIDDIIDKIDFMKVDTEGAEIEALKSCGNLLNSKPILAIEIHKVPNLIKYQKQIKDKLSSYSCWMVELEEYLRDIEIPFPKNDRPNNYAKYNERLLCW